MSNKKRYYRTAALLGPPAQQVVARPRASRTRDARTRDARETRVRDSAPALHIPWKVLVLLLAVAGMAAWIVVGDVWYLTWDGVTVTGLSTPQLERTIKLTADIVGYHRFHLKPREAEQVLEAAFPWVSGVQVRCGLIPASCDIRIKERIPALVWVEGSDVYWVDETGHAFPALGERPDLPVIRGMLPEADSPYTLAAILNGITQLELLGIPANELECSRERGLVWTDPEGLRVAFGAGTGMVERWHTYQLMVKHFAETGIAAQQLDVRFRDGITYTLGRSW
jgi:hypothetical protein